MSAITKIALVSKLSGDSVLVGLLGKDEAGCAAIFNATMNQKQRDLAIPGNSWTLPCITFRESDGSADIRFAAQTIDKESFDIEVWADTQSALTVPQILAEVDRLLHNQSLALSAGTNYDIVRSGGNPDLYDDKLKLHFGLARYRLVVSRS